ncbi:tripartite-type tricarboxylate transporter receptor subunit TctC [Humitalea rosea]|uniref:Tripartite-type tricarboxylate transporter receptor subunit TctC n=1 Tax=Humitalea rosea TaxID=990373 RepID=A0A2W7I9I2_9PROT|nr:tripartite tricarboxylate transporter substrate-binding protein [Humitalea rosea]PZW43551.1 tripartite-type tricarboxylate transporter receptor subunit TctC [Humitalea rosea]
MRLTRRLLCPLLLSPALVRGARAEAPWPGRSLRFVSSSPPAGASDILSRTLAQAVQEQTGQTVVVENRASAGGIVGSDYVAKAAPDGLTWLTTNVGPQAIVRALQPSIPYDTRTDFRHVTLIGTLPLVLVVNPKMLPARDLQALLALARAQPGALNYGTGGNGTLHHLTGEMVKLTAGVDIVHVPYRGAQAATQDLIGGRIQLMWDSLPSAAPHIRAGTLVALAVSGAQRSPAFPDVPTVAEQGLTEVVTTNWFGMAGPARAPEEAVQGLHRELVKALSTKAVRDRFATIGVEPGGMPPAETQAFVLAEIERWDGIVKRTGVTLD